MSMFLQPASEAHCPEATHQIRDEEFSEHYDAWKYRVGYEVDDDGNDVPPWGNTALIRILEDGMTEPVDVVKPEHHASFTIDVLGGRGRLIRALASGATEVVELQEDDKIVIAPGQTYSIVNIGKEDLLLRDVAMPAFQPSDEVKLTESRLKPERDRYRRQSDATSYAYIEMADGTEKTITRPARFYDLVGEAAAGRMKTNI